MEIRTSRKSSKKMKKNDFFSKILNKDDFEGQK